MKLLDKNEKLLVSGGWNPIQSVKQGLKNTRESWLDDVINQGENVVKKVVKTVMPEPEIVEVEVVKIIERNSTYDSLKQYDWVHCLNQMSFCTVGWNNGTQYNIKFS